MSAEHSDKSPSNGSADPGGVWSDLSLRLLSGLLLGVTVLVITWYGSWPFIALLGLGGIIACWEWGRIVRDGAIDELCVLHALSVLAAGVMAVLGRFEVALLILTLGPSLKFIISDDKTAGNLALSLFGVPYVGLPLLAMLWFRGDDTLGLYAILYLFLVVWSVDIFAYVTGRSIGGPKLAPHLSPKKTWSGFIGGVASGAIAGVLFVHFALGSASVKLFFVSLAIAVASQFGDLFISKLKRQFDIKDVSNLIPGHGGLLDRVDGLMAGALLAAGLALLFGGETPGQALLMWN